MENEKALEKLRKVQIGAKEKEKKMTQEIVALMNQLACSQASATLKPSKQAVYASLSETLTLRGGILDVQAQEETLRNKLDKVYRFFYACHFIRTVKLSFQTLPFLTFCLLTIMLVPLNDNS